MYQARLTVGDAVRTQGFEVRKDPRLDDVTMQDFEAQFVLASQVRDRIDEILDALRTITSVREQVDYVAERAKEARADSSFFALTDALKETLKAVENKLHQTRNQSNQDPIRFAPRLDNQYLELYGNVTGTDGYIAGGPEGRPTAGAQARLGDLDAAWNTVKAELDALMQTDVPALNAAYARLNLAPIAVPPRARTSSLEE